MNDSNKLKLPSLFLASQSPRRKNLLEILNIQFTVLQPNATEEKVTKMGAETLVQENAYRKAQSVIQELTNDSGILIGADTLVVLESDIIGKPTNEADVKANLKKLSGKTHEVVTGLALLSPQYGDRKCAVKSSVTFRKLSDDEIEGYAKIKEPYDKAGSYAVQGVGSLFIESLKGSYSNVMGFPIEAFLTELSSLTKIPIFQWFK